MPEPWVGVDGTVYAIAIITILLIFGLGLYFLPWLIALGRGNKNTGGIFLLNLLLGWTLLAWIVCFVWAFVGKSE